MKFCELIWRYGSLFSSNNHPPFVVNLIDTLMLQHRFGNVVMKWKCNNVYSLTIESRMKPTRYLWMQKRRWMLLYLKLNKILQRSTRSHFQGLGIHAFSNWPIWFFKWFITWITNFGTCTFSMMKSKNWFKMKTWRTA
jgi:hypothetical protein